MIAAIDPAVEREDLTDDQRVIARSLRDAARIVGAAGLPHEYRQTAYAVIAPLLIGRTAEVEARG